MKYFDLESDMVFFAWIRPNGGGSFFAYKERIQSRNLKFHWRYISKNTVLTDLLAANIFRLLPS